MCGSGELGKEVVIELQRYGIEVIALDSYPDAPAMQVADRSHVLSMLDEIALGRVIEKEKPDLIVPEVEAIATKTLSSMEASGLVKVIPSAHATQLTMNREGIRKLASEELGLKTSPYVFAGSKDEFRRAVEKIGFPCVVKPIMSSSGKGQSTITCKDELEGAWEYSQIGGRAGRGRVIVEGFVEFEYEITLLTARHIGGISFCDPIGHIQVGGDYRESWQPHPMSSAALEKAKICASTITDALGGRGMFGVEMFVTQEEVLFSEVSPRPHDTGMVTMISQDLSQFALHVRAILGLPIPSICQFGPSASSVILAKGESSDVSCGTLHQARSEPDTQIRLFGKPQVSGQRRMGVALARGRSLKEARLKAKRVSDEVSIDYGTKNP